MTDVPRNLKIYEEGENGWTEWIAPREYPGYFYYQCCGCGLTHALQFTREIDGEKRIIFRAKRVL